MYKDKDKQKQAQKERTRRYRQRQQGVTEGVTSEGVTPLNEKALQIPNYGQADCQCKHCQSNRANGSRHTINHGDYKPAALLGATELNRAALPGDPDYAGVYEG